MKTKNMVVCALFAAIICITAPFSIPIGPVPVTMTVFSLALTAFVLGSKKAAVATAVYMLVGIAGLPVFAGFKSGLTSIMSPVGGFAFSYIFIVLILGIRAKKKRIVVLLCISAMLVCYICGTAWYMFMTGSELLTALSLCIIPFIPFDIIKLVLAYIVGKAVRKRLKKAKLL